MLSYSFERKTTVVTGGGGGIGRAIALRFATAGAYVVIADIAEPSGRETVDMIESRGGAASYIKTDVSEAHDVENLMAGAVSLYGRVDCACNVAAIDLETTSLVECNDEIFDRVIAVNLRGTYLCMKHEVTQMRRQGGPGAIVNFASVAAYRSKALYLNAYVASKQGVLALTRIAAMQYGKEGIRINAIVPGAVDTPLLRTTLAFRKLSIEELGMSYGLLGRVGKPEEIAEAALWLCSEYSSFTVGAVLAVDGGALIA